MCTKDERSRCWLERAIGESLNQRDGLGGLFHHAQPAKVGTHNADELIADFFGMHNHTRAGSQEAVQFVEEGATPLVDVVTGEEGQMSTRHSQLVVRMQIVGSAADVDDAVEVVLTQPYDFLLATNLAVARTVSARSFTNGELILDDPDEIAGLDS